MKQFTFSILAVLFLVSCTKKAELDPIKRLVGNKFKVVSCPCGNDTTDFFLSAFTDIEFETDEVGSDYYVGNTQVPFEWSIDENNIILCPTTSSVSLTIPFSFSGDTLKMRRPHSFCSQGINVSYVKL
jgi:hypothetical protein